MGGGTYNNVEYFENLTPDDFWLHWNTHVELVKKQQESARKSKKR
jgi:hypothetical protein